MKLTTLKQQFLSSRNNLLIHNRYILYILLLVSLANLYYLAISQDYFSVVIFLLVGFLTTFFSKNMIIIMFFALVFTFILKNSNSPSLEGLTNKDKDVKKESMKTSSDEDEDEDEEKSSDKKSNKKKTTSSTDDEADETDEKDLKLLSSSSSKNKTKSSKTTQENLVGSEFNSGDMNASEVITKIKKIVEVLQN